MKPWSCVLLVALIACSTSPENPMVAAASRGDLDSLARLMDGGAEPNQADLSGETPVIVAARAGHSEAIRLLVKRGADPGLRDGRSTGWTPLLHALHKNQIGTMMALLDVGADMNGVSAAGVTPLMMAAGYGNTRAVEILLARGADTHMETPAGATALSAAVEGVADIDCFTLGSCQTETVRAILSHDPHAPLGREARRARFIARLAGCSDVLRLVSRRG